MSGDFAVIDHELGTRVGRPCFGVDESVYSPVAVEKPVKCVEVGAGDVPAVGARVGGEFVLIQVLQRVSVRDADMPSPAVHVLLEGGQIVQAWWFLMPFGVFHVHDIDGLAAVREQVCECVGIAFVGVAGPGECPSAHGDADCPVGFADMTADPVITVYDHPQRRRLHTSDAHMVPTRTL